MLVWRLPSTAGCNRHLKVLLPDEAPAAYKNVESVLRAQTDLVKIVRRLQPVLSYKGR